MIATNKLIVETKGKKVTIYSTEIINKIYNDLSYFVFRYNESQASEIPTDKYKVTLNDFIKIKESKGDKGQWWRELANDIKQQHQVSTKFGSFFKGREAEKSTMQIKAAYPLTDIYYYLNCIDETYLTSEIFKFKHEELSDQINPFSHDGNKLYLRDKDTIIKRIIGNESVTISKDKWEQFCELFQVTNFIGNVQIKDAIQQQNTLINYINDNNENISNLCKWNIKRLRTLIKDKENLCKEIWHNGMEELAHSLGVENAQRLIENVPPAHNTEMYEQVRTEIKPFMDFCKNIKEKAYYQTMTIWKDGIINIDDNNVLTINEKEREKVLKEHFNYYEFDYPSMSEERRKNAFDEINQGIENEKKIEDIIDIINGHISPLRH